MSSCVSLRQNPSPNDLLQSTSGSEVWPGSQESMIPNPKRSVSSTFFASLPQGYFDDKCNDHRTSNSPASIFSSPPRPGAVTRPPTSAAALEFAPFMEHLYGRPQETSDLTTHYYSLSHIPPSSSMPSSFQQFLSVLPESVLQMKWCRPAYRTGCDKSEG